MACRQCLSLSAVQLKGIYCRKPHCHNGVLDTFGHTLFSKIKPKFCRPDAMSIYNIQLFPWSPFILLIKSNYVIYIPKFKLILYLQIKNSITHLTIRHSMSSRLEFFCTTGQREAPIAAWSFLHLVHLRGRGGSSKSHSIKSLAFWSTTICSYR